MLVLLLCDVHEAVLSDLYSIRMTSDKSLIISNVYQWTKSNLKTSY